MSRKRSGAKSGAQWGPRILLIAGAVFGGLGLFLGFVGFREKDFEQARSLPVLSPASDFTPGSEVLVSGRLAAHEPLEREGFVVFNEEEFMGYESGGASAKKPHFRQKTFVRKELSLEGDGRVLVVCPRGYLLGGKLHRAGYEALLTRGDLVRPATTRRTGLRPGDRLTIFGRTSATSGGCFEAEKVFGGEPQDYVESLRTGAFVLRLVGGIFVLVGAIFGLIAFRIRSR